jgi:hypothetical protein
MTMNVRRTRRPGSVLPLAVLTMVSMCGFVALAIDLGVLAVAKTQCQNSADAAAMAGARSLDGTAGQNLGDVNTPGTSMYIAQHTALDNKVLTDSITASNVTLTYGAWHYDVPSQLFVPQFPPVLPDNYNLVQANVSYTVHTNFAGAFSLLPGNSGFSPLITVQASAQAAHRPRDVAMILDYSGSMNNESDLWNCESYLDNGANNTTNGYTWPKSNNPAWTSNNEETIYPLFGHYAGTNPSDSFGNNYNDYTANPNMLCPAASGGSGVANNPLIGKSNVSNDLTATLGIPNMVNDFYSNNRGSSVAYAFTAQPASTYATAPAGDVPLRLNGSTTTGAFAMNVNDIVNGGNAAGANTWNSNWETKGYKKYTGATFNGYTVGPGYWGKTFFIWPPDPLPANDWRKKFFKTADGSAPLNDNTQMFQNGSFSGGGIGYQDPAGNYQINYQAILAWIKNTTGTGNVNPFPSQLRSGNVLIYSSIPTDVPAAAYDHTQPNANIADPDQRFWKEYIDWTLGVWRDPTGSIQHTFQPTCSIGPDFMFSSKGSITADSTQFGSATSTVQIHVPPTTTSPTPAHNPPEYMNYLDNPWRPRHRMWFGPMTMVQFMSDCGYLPGTTHDISMFPMKQGVGGALLDIQNNHPNDLLGMLLFSRPVYGNDPPNIGSFNVPQYSLTNDYASMLSSLWLPPNSGSSDIRLFGDPNGALIPHAHADFDSNTASSFGFMLAFNQFSGNRSALVGVPGMDGSTPTTVGGLGRKGATRLVIFETDGMANEDSIPQSGITNAGAYNSYYNIRPSDKVNGGNYNQNALLQVAEALCNRDDGTPVVVPTGYPTPPNVPGYATINKPVLIHCIAFGAIFETPNSAQTSAVPMMQQISTIGNTTFPSSSTDPANGYKWCIGTLQQRQDKLRQAFLNILDSSVPVSLIK